MITEYNEGNTWKIDSYLSSTKIELIKVPSSTRMISEEKLVVIQEIGEPYSLAYIKFEGQNPSSRIIGDSKKISQLETMAGLKGNPEKGE